MHSFRRNRLGWFCLGVWLVVSGVVAAATAGDPPRPNMVVFITDDQGQADSLPYGGQGFRTPNMRRLANEGLVFDQAYVASPSCAPSRAALLTGLMPARNGAEPNHSKPRAELKKWPAYFQELGYEVVAFGKVSHYKHTADYGFDSFAYDGFHEDGCVQAAVEYLRDSGAHRSKPLCLMVGTNWPHVPWPTAAVGDNPARMKLPPGSVDTPATRRWRARYATAVAKADEDLGKIRQAAEQSLGESTLFVFTSDHGAQWPFAKWNCYEVGVRVPLIVSWRGVVKPGTRTSAMVSWVDILPTLVQAAGGEPPADLDGRSFFPVLTDELASHRDRVFTTHSGDGRWNIYPIRSLRDDRWKYILNLHPDYAFTTHIDLPAALGQRDFFSTWEAEAERSAEAAAIVRRYHVRPAEELYDLRADPDEQHSLAGDPGCAGELARLRNELRNWMEQQGDQRRVFANPRLLSEPDSYGPNAVGGASEGKKPAKRAAARQ